MGYFYNLFTGMFNLFKTKLFLLLQIIAAFLMPIKALMVMVGLMILLDTITGIWKAKKLHEIITSRKLSKVVSKMVLYQIGIITFFCLDRYILGEMIGAFTSIPFFLTKIVAVFFCGIELLSINENVYAVTDMNFYRMFRKMLTRTKEVKQDIDDIVGGNNTNEPPIID